MDLKLHANATTTPRIRAYIQKSSASIAALARELGIHNRTVARWKARTQVLDRSTRPHRLATTMTDWEEALIVELRRSLALPLDDITEAMRRCVNPRLSRSAIHRCLQRHAISARLTPDKAPAAAFQTAAPAGFIHIDVKYLPPLNRRRSYAYVAIDRATRFVYLEILPDRRAQTAAGFLDRFRASFPLEIHTILTDNGSEFTDRFAVNKKGKPPDKPSGQHPFDRLCARHAITHRLTRPFRPQTNGMVERFNRRLGDHLDRMPQNRAAHHRRFLDHAERDAYLHTFVADYNRTRLHCLDYHAPAELLAKLTGHNTQAGVAQRLHRHWRHKARSDQAMRQQICQPHRVVHVGLAAGHVLDVHRIGEHEFECLGEDGPDRLPIDPGRLHRDMADGVARQPARQPLQLRSRRAKRLDVLLNPTTAGQTDAGHDTVTVDIEAGATRMKYLHDPSSLRRRRGAHEIEPLECVLQPSRAWRQYGVHVGLRVQLATGLAAPRPNRPQCRRQVPAYCRFHPTRVEKSSRWATSLQAF